MIGSLISVLLGALVAPRRCLPVGFRQVQRRAALCDTFIVSLPVGRALVIV